VASHTVSAASSTLWAETVLRRQFDSRERMRIRTQRLTDTRGGRMVLGREGNWRVHDFSSCHRSRQIPSTDQYRPSVGHLARERTYDARGRVARRARDEVHQYFPRVSPSRPTSHHLVNMV
jgi:hypothetical protein